MAFSGALTLTDLNDYLGPSQACIKPIEDIPPPQGAPIDPETNLASTQIAIDKDGTYYESSTASEINPDGQIDSSTSKPRPRTKLETAAISLDDCLACSGCVTSAESVLVGLQSVDELWKRLEEFESLPNSSKPLLYASISPQSLASLSAYLTHISRLSRPIPLPILLFRVSHFLKTNPKLKFNQVVDTTFARHLTLREHGREFLRRKERQKTRGRNHRGVSNDKAQLPMIASACPGWVCYAEKAQHEMLDLVSTTKSPMLMNGILAKRWSAPFPSSDESEAGGVQEAENDKQFNHSSFRKRRIVFHVSVMPCYDKKLESARPSISTDSTDYLDEELVSNLKQESEKDVDLVLTTGELVKLMADEDFQLEKEIEGEVEFSRNLRSEDPIEFSKLHHKDKSRENDYDKENDFLPIPSLLNHPNLHSGSSSGGYLFSILQSVWSEYLENLSSTSNVSGSRPSLPTLLIRTVRNSDYTEYVLRSAPDSDGKSQLLFKGAHCYGFRNLQNLVRKVKNQMKREDLNEVENGHQDRFNASSVARGKSNRGKMTSRGGLVRGRGGKMSKRGGASGNPSSSSSKIYLDDDFSMTSSTSNLTASSVEGDLSQGTQISREIATEETIEDAFSTSIPYDYVEIMACPGGCVNGGGQLRPPTAGNSLLLNGKETKNLLGTSHDILPGPTGSFASGIGRDTAMTEAQTNESGNGNGNENEKSRSDGIHGKEPRLEPYQEVEEGINVPKNGRHDDDDDVAVVDDEEMQNKGWKGTNKEWVGKVEEAYWKSDDLKEFEIHSGFIPSLIGKGEENLHSSTGTGQEQESTRSSRSSSDSSESVTSSTPPTSLSASTPPPSRNPIHISITKEMKSRLENQLEIQTNGGKQVELKSQLENLSDGILEEICTSHFNGQVDQAEIQAMRKALFQTKYNAVKDEAVSGLAVQW